MAGCMACTFSTAGQPSRSRRRTWRHPAVRSCADAHPAPRLMGDPPAIRSARSTVCTIPTDAPESDGTLAWDSTTIVLVEVDAAGVTGVGYTYGDAAVAGVVDGTLAGVLEGRDPLAVPAAWMAMRRAVRNSGERGLAAMAISAADIALWDLAARLLGRPLATVLGAYRDAVPIYGSGGFCSYDDEQLARQLGGWAAEG